MDGGQIGLLLAIVVLIVFSGFFSASEMAYTSVNKIRLLNMEQNGNKRAGKVLREPTIAKVLSFSNKSTFPNAYKQIGLKSV
jgi:CBS domain containing-hemolysin-like protein